jgi:hypothetical protein
VFHHLGLRLSDQFLIPMFFDSFTHPRGAGDADIERGITDDDQIGKDSAVNGTSANGFRLVTRERGWVSR